MTSTALIAQAFRDMAPWGYVMAALVGVGLVCALIGLLAGRRRDEPAPVGWRVLSIALTAAAAVVAIVAVQKARAGMVAAAFGTILDPSDKATGLASSLTTQMNVLAFGFEVVLPALVACVLAAAIPAALRARSTAGRSAGLLAALASVAPLVVVTGIGTQYMLSFIHGFAGLAGVDPSIKPTLFLRLLAETHAALEKGRAALLVTSIGAAIALAIAATIAARGGVELRSRARGIALLLAAAGGLAFAGTRPHAWDAAHPIDDRASEVISPEALRKAPDYAGPCPPLERMEILTVDDKGALLAGRPIAEPSDVGDQLATLRNNYRLLHPSESFPGTLGLIVPAATPTAAIARWLRAIPPGYDHPVVLTAHPAPVETRTLGRIERFASCQIPLAFDDGAPPITGYATWGDVLAAALKARDAGPHALRVSVGNGGTAPEDAPAADGPGPAAPDPKSEFEACRKKCRALHDAGELAEGVGVERCVQAVCGEPPP